GSGLGEARQTGVRQRDDDTASICIGVGSADEAFLNEPCHASRHAGLRDERSGREICHAQLAPRACQLSEHIEVCQRESCRLRETNLEAAHEGGVCPQERVPCLESTPARQLASYEPVEKSSSVGFRRYLHTQQPITKMLALASIS